MAVKDRDFPVGHPSSADYDPASPEAIEWKRQNLHPLGTRDYPVGHPAAADHPDNIGRKPYEDMSRDFSRPQTIPAAEYEGVTGRNHAEDVEAYKKREAELAAKRAAAARPAA